MNFLSAWVGYDFDLMPTFRMLRVRGQMSDIRKDLWEFIQKQFECI
tara:strand:+ start:38 stop:175 length:138 start_codon:yes stop_codon:yes gene_type:complete